VDDALSVHTILTSISGARISARQQIFSGKTLLTDGRIEACIVTLSGRPRRIPENIRTLLTPFLYETET
jgi:acyl-CoA thioester hydrolase